LVTNPIGNSPAVIALVKDFDFSRQRWIMFREGVFSLIIALFFQYFGEKFLDLVGIQNYAVTLCGGVVLFLVSLHMIFSLNEQKDKPAALKQEPFIVPIATPLLSGPGLLTIIMMKSHLVQNPFLITSAILIAFSGVIFIMIIAPYLQKILGKAGLLALEQLMGLMLALIAMDMFVHGIRLFVEYLSIQGV
jgi:multiple antibiotic resistance protein